MPSVSSANRGADGGRLQAASSRAGDAPQLQARTRACRSRGQDRSPTSDRTTPSSGSGRRTHPGKSRLLLQLRRERREPAGRRQGIQPDCGSSRASFGLRVVSDDEAARIRVTPGKDVGTLTLTESQKSAQGDSLIKETVLEESTGRIREHWVYSADHKTPLAHAVVNDYQEYPRPQRRDRQARPPRRSYPARRSSVRGWMQQEKMSHRRDPEQVKVNPKGFSPDRCGRRSSPSRSSRATRGSTWSGPGWPAAVIAGDVSTEPTTVPRVAPRPRRRPRPARRADPPSALLTETVEARRLRGATRPTSPARPDPRRPSTRAPRSRKWSPPIPADPDDLRPVPQFIETFRPGWRLDVAGRARICKR